MAGYDFKAIENKWQKRWLDTNLYEVKPDPNKPKYYILDMFPYPSGAGLHVGHPLGYIASDIMARYKILKGYNVLHPMGFDAFGLPAEQYAIQTGKHPTVTTEKNITRYKQQLDSLGLSYDWNREVRTCDPDYYKWTQFIFIKLFEHYFDPNTKKAVPIKTLVKLFENQGFDGNDEVNAFTAQEWNDKSEKEQQDLLMHFRLAFKSDTTVNWCEELGTVLANEEVKDGKSERGGFPVVKRKMSQWFMRITDYANRLLNDLDAVDWPESLKEMQRNWIGKSRGAELTFQIANNQLPLTVFTTRPDTVFGCSFMVVAPEFEGLENICVGSYKTEALAYASAAQNRSERERLADAQKVTGKFTGSYAIHPFTGKEIPIWVADYVLGGYGTGAVMAVPAHDERDHIFAKTFDLPIVQVVDDGSGHDISAAALSAKSGVMINSDTLNGLKVKDAIKKAIEYIAEKKIGKPTTNFRLRDAGFSRQRYWGEPFPIEYINDIPYPLKKEDLPLELPEVPSYKPAGNGESPLAQATEWVHTEKGRRETDTMPGWAGSSWYFIRYTDPLNDNEIASQKALDYWQNVDLYIGGAEHATGHLLYARFWTKFLNDIDLVPFNEPFKKLINQGMIQGRSLFLNVKGQNERSLHVPIELADEKDRLFEDKWQHLLTIDNRFEGIDPEDLDWLQNEEGSYLQLTSAVEKMSKSKFNVVNPDDVCEKFGADTLRLYEMFLGPLEDSKPWSTSGIDGVHRFLNKVWRLFEATHWDLSEGKPSKEELKALHKALDKLEQDIDRFSFNTCVSTFMIAVNELTALKCANKNVLKPLLIALAPFAPHLTEEIWENLGHTNSIFQDGNFPKVERQHLIEDTKVYPVSVNGKMRTKLEFPLDTPKETIEQSVLQNEVVKKWLDGKAPKKVIVVPGKIVNVVI